MYFICHLFWKFTLVIWIVILSFQINWQKVLKILRHPKHWLSHEHRKISSHKHRNILIYEHRNILNKKQSDILSKTVLNGGILAATEYKSSLWNEPLEQLLCENPHIFGAAYRHLFGCLLTRFEFWQPTYIYNRNLSHSNLKPI